MQEYGQCPTVYIFILISIINVHFTVYKINLSLVHTSMELCRWELRVPCH